MLGVSHDICLALTSGSDVDTPPQIGKIKPIWTESRWYCLLITVDVALNAALDAAHCERHSERCSERRSAVDTGRRQWMLVTVDAGHCRERWLPLVDADHCGRWSLP